MARTEGVEDAAQTVDLPEHALDYIIEACLDYCRDTSNVSASETALIQVQAIAAEKGARAVEGALRRAAFSPSATEDSLAAEAASCSTQAGGWGIVAMQRSLL